MKKFFIAFCTLIFNFAVFAESLSFQIFQHSNGIKEVSEQTYRFEDELLNYFFENGKIISNEKSLVSVSKNADSKEVIKSMNNAIEGSLDNFCEIHLYFEDAKESQKDDLNLLKVVWKVSSVKNQKKSEENKIIVKKPGNADSEGFIKSVAVELGAELQKSLKSKA